MRESNTHNQDLDTILFNHCQVSSSQEQSLRAPSVRPHTHHTPASADYPPPSDTIVMVSPSDAIVMVSPPDSPEPVPQDVFHTPPENSSLPSSCDQLRDATAGDDPCAVNHAVDFEAGSEFVDLGRDSELGFSEIQLTQEMGVDECSHGAGKGVLGEIRGGRFDEFSVFPGELSDLSELPVKKRKLGDFDVNSSGGCVKVQSPKVEEDERNHEGNLVSEAEKISDENNCSSQNLETFIGDVSLCESEKVSRTVYGSKPNGGVAEGSRMGEKSDEKPVPLMFPTSMHGRSEDATSESECLKNATSESECLKNAASEVECGKNWEKKNVFDVLRILSEISNEEDENLDDISLLEVAEACGITFPRPRWWPKVENFDSYE